MTANGFEPDQQEYLRSRERGLLATVAPNGTPQCKPVGFRLDDDGEIEIAGYELERSAKFRNLELHPDVAFTVEDVPDAARGAEGVRFVEIRGRAYTTQLDEAPIEHLSRWVIRIRPRRVLSYNVGEPGLRTIDVGGPEPDRGRPGIALGGRAAERGSKAAEALVAELQEGLDDGDAETYNRHFAADVLWGSPWGRTVEGGYEALHAIHREMLPRGEQRHSRYEIVAARAVAPDVVLAQVRRTELDDNGNPIPSIEGAERFSEMALYAFVRRDDECWLAAGQNTVVVSDRGAVAQS